MRLPLFPLHTVLCPGIALPLHIFEERYREMTRYCLDTPSPFGVVLIRDGREVGGSELSFSAIGTMAEIRKAGRYPDGRFDLLAVGTGRFAIEEVRTDEEPYLVAEVDPARRRGRRRRTRHDAWRTSRPAGSSATSSCSSRGRARRPTRSTSASRSRPRTPTPATAEASETIGEVEVEQGDETVRRRVVIPDDPTTLSYLLAGIIQVELPRRQALLEAETTDERLRDLLELIDRETMLLRRRLRAFIPTPTAARPPGELTPPPPCDDPYGSRRLSM